MLTINRQDEPRFEQTRAIGEDRPEFVVIAGPASRRGCWVGFPDHFVWLWEVLDEF
jgi:hypothetical protein